MSVRGRIALVAATTLIAGGASAEGPEPWSFSATAYAYFVPDDPNFVLPIMTADRGWLHLEGRYNYEAQNTTSVWAGYNWSVGDQVTMDSTWMIGAVIGDVDGYAPGCEITVAWKKLEFYTEGEYVFDNAGHEENFLYFWSELTYAPREWFRFGLVSQRTRAYESELDVQRGLVLGFSRKDVTFTTYVFDTGASDPAVVVSFGVEF